MGGYHASASRQRSDSDKLKKEVAAARRAGLAASESVGVAGTRGEDFGLEELVSWASARGDGWVRIVPALTGEIHWKWRFTSGCWAGHYIYWCQTKYETATEAVKGLARKLDLVDEGHLRPSKDVY